MVDGSEQQYFLKTERLGFRWWSQQDLPRALALWGDPQVGRLIGGPLSQPQVEAKLRQEMAWGEGHRMQYWPIFLLAGGEHAGCAGLRPYKPAEGIPELGFHLLPSSWGKGLAEEAGRAVTAYAFAALGAKGIFAAHHQDNAASRRVLEKLGFRRAGEEFYAPTASMHPCYLLERPRPSGTG
jgi:[ribosomal protein S5]-alanine N-acetyltransferase